MTDEEVTMSQLAQGETDTAASPPMVIEGPPASTAVAVRRQALPKELSALGVQVAVDQESGMQILIIPKELRAKANVLTPVQAFQQADPNWTPSLRVVELDPSKDGPHFYKQGSNLAPRKQALELLADAAGITQLGATLVGRERVEIGGVVAETFTHVAVGKVRKSDGTLRTLQASRTYEPFAEYEDVRDQVKRADRWENGSKAGKYQEGTVEYDAEVRKRWLNEIKFAKAKNESKAINRVIRSAIQSSQTYSAAEAAKPFVVVGWNLAPQDSQAVHAAIAQLYGAAPEQAELTAPTAADWSEPEIASGEVLEDDASEASSQQAPVAAPAPPAVTGAPGATDSSDERAASEPREEGPRSPAPADGGSDEQAPGMAARTPEPSSSTGSPAGADASTAADAPEAEREPPSAGDQEPVASLQSPPAPSSSEPEIPGVSVAAPSQTTEAGLAAAVAVKIPSGSYQGRSLGWVLELGEPADEWLAYALRQPWPHDQAFKAALAVAVRAHRPEMHAAWSAEA